MRTATAASRSYLDSNEPSPAARWPSAKAYAASDDTLCESSSLAGPARGGEIQRGSCIDRAWTISRPGIRFRSGAISSFSEKRREPRFSTALNAHYSTGPEEGIGVLANISNSGALVEGSSVRPTVGSKVRIYVFTEPVDPIAPASPYELVGRVIRHSHSGFAIEYEESDPEVCRLVEQVAASQD